MPCSVSTPSPTAGGLTIIEVTNDSTLPIAVAFTGGGLLSRRPPTAMPPQGIDLPADAVIFPVGHHATLIVARASQLPATRCRKTLPSADQVVARLARADAAGQPAAAARRCRWSRRSHRRAANCCSTDRSAAADDDLDPATFLLGVAELVRMGERAVDLGARHRHTAGAIGPVWHPDRRRRGRGRGAGAARGGGAPSGGRSSADEACRRSTSICRTRLPAEPALVPSWVEHTLVIVRRARGAIDAGVVPAGVARRRLRGPRPCRSGWRRRCRSPSAGTATARRCCGRSAARRCP